jgi:hypothetical protein
VRGYHRAKEFELLTWRASYAAFLNANGKKRYKPEDIIKLPSFDHAPKAPKITPEAIRKFEQSIKGYL